MSLPPSLWFELALLAFLGWELYALRRPDRSASKQAADRPEPGGPDEPR